MDKAFTVHAGSQGFDSHRGHMSERFFWCNRPGYPHPLCSEPENSGIRVVVVIAVSLKVGGGVHLIKPAKLYMCMQTHYKHDEDGRTAPDVRGHGSVPLSHSGNVIKRIGLHTHTYGGNYSVSFIICSEVWGRNCWIDGRDKWSEERWTACHSREYWLYEVRLSLEKPHSVIHIIQSHTR